MAREAKAMFTGARERLVKRLEAEANCLRLHIRTGKATNSGWRGWREIHERLSIIILESCELNAAEQLLQRLTEEAPDGA